MAKIGDVIRVTFYNGRQLRPIGWVIATDTHSMPNIEWLRGSPYEPAAFIGWENILDNDDKWEVVPLEKWPPKVCHAMMMRSLIEGETP